MFLNCNMFERRCKKQNLPKICSRTGRYINCNLNKQKEDDVVFAIRLLKDAEEAKSGTNKWLIENNILVNIDHTIDARGLAACFSEEKVIYINPLADVGTFMHEYAHCKEGVARLKKGMPMLRHGETGDWIKISETRSIPVGHERRAEHFRQRLPTIQNPKIERVHR